MERWEKFEHGVVLGVLFCGLVVLVKNILTWMYSRLEIYMIDPSAGWFWVGVILGWLSGTFMAFVASEGKKNKGGKNEKG